MANTEKTKSSLGELDRTSEENYKKAKILFQMGRFEEALAAYGEACENWTKMGEIFFEKGNKGSGREFLDKAKEARSGYGMTLFKLERYQEALEIINSSLEINSNSSIEWSNRGFVLSALGRNEEALEAFDRALCLDPESPKILTSKGIVYFKMGQAEKALEIFDKALEIEPRNASDWVCKVPRFSFFSRNKAPIMRPDNAETWYWKGTVFLKLGEKEKALDACKMALESDPDHVGSLLRGGDLLCKLTDYKEAFKCYVRVLKLSPDNESAKQGKEFCEAKINE